MPSPLRPSLRPSGGPFESLYVHFPFCETKCHYCDFYSLGREKTGTQDPVRFSAALQLEAIRWAAALAPKLKTLFFGGGTPSMTDPEAMEEALAPLALRGRVDAATEWTMEANPSSVASRGRMESYRALGINRVSMGVQSLNDDLLRLLGRVHSRQAALTALGTVFEAGFTNVSVDLICGVPGQSLEQLTTDIEELAAFPITHLSCYLLTLPKKHPLAPKLPDEDAQVAHLLRIDEKLKALGFEHYEISNFAKPGRRAEHNLAYWKGGSYLGLGPSAHSFDPTTQTRWKNLSSLHRYATALAAGEPVTEAVEALTDEQQALERWLLAVRLDEGFPSLWLTQNLQRTRAQALERAGMIEPHPSLPGRLRLTSHGFPLSDQIVKSLALGTGSGS